MKINFQIAVGVLSTWFLWVVYVYADEDRTWHWSFGRSSSSKVCTLRTYVLHEAKLLDINCMVDKEFCITAPLLKVYYPPPVPQNFPQLKFVKDMIFCLCRKMNPKMPVYNFNISTVWNLEQSLEMLENNKNHLENLEISGTSLHKMPNSFYCTLDALKSLVLTGNKISKMEDLGIDFKKSSCSSALQELTFLDLSENHIQKILVELNFLKLEELHLQGNEIKEVKCKIFSKLPHLKVLDLSRNLLEQLPDKLFHNLNNLRELDLHENFISRLTDSFSQDLFNVIKLDISHNELEEISPSSLSNLSSLVELNLSINHIGFLRGKEFQNLTSLKYLNLEKNNISTIGIESFAQNRNLRSINLNSNNLKDVSVWEMLKNVSITIGKNPWNCDCEFIRQMVRMIEENKLHVKDSFDLYCEENLNFKNNPPKYLLNPLEVCSLESEGYIKFNGNVDDENVMSTTEIVNEDTTIMYGELDDTINEIF